MRMITTTIRMMLEIVISVNVTLALAPLLPCLVGIVDVVVVFGVVVIVVAVGVDVVVVLSLLHRVANVTVPGLLHRSEVNRTCDPISQLQS